MLEPVGAVPAARAVRTTNTSTATPRSAATIAPVDGTGKENATAGAGAGAGAAAGRRRGRSEPESEPGGRPGPGRRARAPRGAPRLRCDHQTSCAAGAKYINRGKFAHIVPCSGRSLSLGRRHGANQSLAPKQVATAGACRGDRQEMVVWNSSARRWRPLRVPPNRELVRQRHHPPSPTNRQSLWAGPRRTRPKRLRLRASAIPFYIRSIKRRGILQQKNKE
eukprot:COSAG06_NODE_221_length_19912_cov_17.460875_6_plen_222_part_00